MSTFITKHANKLGLKKQDGKKRLEISVQTCDVKNSTRKSPGNCAFARAAKRSLKGVKKAYFFRSTAWLEYDDKIVRYALPASAQMEVVAFDRSRSFEPGDDFPVELWQRYASPVWMDIDPGNTLQYMSAREQADERHIAPLQLGVIDRALMLWSNPGDTVLSPYAGIGSEGYQALERGRRFVGVELKESYFRTAVRNLRKAGAQKTLATVG